MIVIVFAGLPGTGKSTLARAVAARLDADVLDKDCVREALFGALVDYSRQQNDLASRAMYREVEALAAHGVEWAVLDGRTYTRRYQVEELREFALSIGIRLALVECVCADEVACSRIERDVLAHSHRARNRTPDLHAELRREQEPIEGEKLVLRTDVESLEDAVELVVEWAHKCGATC